VHDEAEIRGHRRTYVAALPGRVIQGIRKAGTNNPVFMLDEVDKLGADFRGDPSAALLEVLDPEQNSTFRDHYLDVDFDLSKVMFIATANMLETIPSPLLDRLEVLQLPGYSEEEKTHIAQKYIMPKQLEQHGLSAKDLSISDAAIRRIIADYTREAGLRNLEREIAAICRKIARRRAEGQKSATIVEPTDIAELLGPSRFFRELADRTGVPGVATGLAWTPTGGEILFIEASGMSGKGGLTLTGLLGESMRESAQAALKLFAKPREGTCAGRFSIRQDRFAYSRACWRCSKGRAFSRRGDHLSTDQLLPRHSDRAQPCHDRRGDADGPRVTCGRRARENPGCPARGHQTGAVASAQRKRPCRYSRRGKSRSCVAAGGYPERRRSVSI
jgi:ATP-dependent Lon protease